MSEAKQVRVSEIIPKPFHKAYSAIRSKKITWVVEKGGRGSGKSYNTPIAMAIEMMREPQNMLCMRKVANTLQESVYNQVITALEKLEVEHYWKFKKSPLQIIYKPTQCYFLFRGADDPSKLKSIKSRTYPLTTLWIEEAAEFRNEDEVRTITNSILREKLPENMRYKLILTYNPPKSRLHWLNKKYESGRKIENTFIHHSTYLDNPYLSEQSLQEIEYIKRTDERRYKWEYLGEPLGDGLQPFNNLIFRKISDEEIKKFDKIRQGLDWGYASPLAWTRAHFEKYIETVNGLPVEKRRVYIFGEIHKTQMQAEDLAKEVISKGWQDLPVITDTNNKDGNFILQKSGIKVRPVSKGKGSVEAGETAMASINEIIIDDTRCPKTADEFENAVYISNKDGTVIRSEIAEPKHSIDSLRYGLEDDLKVINAKFVPITVPIF